jgi:hypothetical protein
MSIVAEFLEAEAAGRFVAVRRRAVRHLHDGGNVRLCVPFHHAGNDFSVVGLAFGRPRQRPEVLVCPPDPLDRIDVSSQLTPFVDSFLQWADAYPVDETHNPNTGRTYFTAERCPQLIVPTEGSRTAIDNWSYFLRHVPSEWANAARLQRVGWELSALIDASEWPGQCALVSLTRSLADHWALGMAPTETESLAAEVALINSGPSGTDWARLRAAEDVSVGPLGDPTTFDDLAYRNARSGAKKANPQVVAVVKQAWEVAFEAWNLLVGVPEASSARSSHEHCVKDWAGHTGAGRIRGRWARRAVPPLGRSAERLARLEDAQAALIAARAADDPLVAAELTAEGDAVVADSVSVDVQQIGKSTLVDFQVATSQQRVPAEQTALLVVGAPKKVIGVVTAVTGNAGQWQLTVSVRAGLAEATGINTAKTLNGSEIRWLVPAPPSYRPPLRLPSGSPATHPGSVVVWNPNGSDSEAPDAADMLDDGGLAGARNA